MVGAFGSGLGLARVACCSRTCDGAFLKALTRHPHSRYRPRIRAQAEDAVTVAKSERDTALVAAAQQLSSVRAEAAAAQQTAAKTVAELQEERQARQQAEGNLAQLRCARVSVEVQRQLAGAVHQGGWQWAGAVEATAVQCGRW